MFWALHLSGHFNPRLAARSGWNLRESELDPKHSGGVRTTIAKHHGRYSKSDHLCQDGVLNTDMPANKDSIVLLAPLASY